MARSHLVISLKEFVLFVYVYVNVFTHVCAGTGRVQKVASGPMELQYRHCGPSSMDLNSDHD